MRRLAALVLVAMVGCGSAEGRTASGEPCVYNNHKLSRPCVCDDGTMGTQYCNHRELTFGDCRQKPDGGRDTDWCAGDDE